MRASTLFGMTIAILIGMAVVFGVKSAGIFDRKLDSKTPVDRPMILAAADNLFQGHATNFQQVMIRPVDLTELDHYNKNKHKYMPAILAAANYRVLNRNVVANEPLLKDHFQDFGMPDSWDILLGPGMKAVNVKLPRDRAGGGLIRKDDRVDVYLTSTITNGMTAETMTAPLAMGLRVVIKRDSIWTVMRGDDESKPIPFTLEANAYRAALIEYAKEKGYLTLVPTGVAEKKKPQQQPFQVESKDEEQRIINITENKNPIGPKDIEEVFKLQPINRPHYSMSMTERWHGVFPKGGHTFPGVSDPNAAPTVNYSTPDGRPAHGYGFVSPGSGTITVPCSTCPGGQKTIPR